MSENTIIQWYYVGQQQKSQGPFTGEQIKQFFQAGIIDKDTNLWHDKLTQWQPLHQHQQTLGIYPQNQPVAESLSNDPFSDYVQPPFSSSSIATATLEPISERVSETTATSNDQYRSPYASSNASTNPYQRHAPILNNHIVYAGFWKRAAASLVDGILIGIVSSILIDVVFLSIVGITESQLDPVYLASNGSMKLLLFFLLVKLILPLAMQATYFGWMHASNKQATLGKLLVGIKVTKSNGEAITKTRGVGRYFATILSSIILGIGFLMAAFTDRKQALHDMICDTLVVDKWAFTEHPEYQTEGLGVATVIILVLMALLFIIAILGGFSAAMMLAQA